MFNFRIRVFHSVATSLSFSETARELNITQPAVTNHIKELESALGISLFYRGQNKISLTNGGKILLKYAKRTINDYKNLEYEIGIEKKAYVGRLRITVSTTVGQYILPPVLARFNARFPDIKISLNNSNTTTLGNDYISNDADLGIIGGSIGRKEFKHIPFLKDEIVAVAHSSQPISKKEIISVNELREIPLVLRETGSGTLDIITKELRKQNIKTKDLNIKMYLGNTESIKSFLANANCLGFVSIYSVSKEISRGEYQIIDIQDLSITRTFNFIYPQGYQNKLRDMFIDFCISNIR